LICKDKIFLESSGVKKLREENLRRILSFTEIGREKGHFETLFLGAQNGMLAKRQEFCPDLGRLTT